MTQEFTEQLAKWEMHMHQLGYRKVVLCKDCKHKRIKSKVWTCPFGLPKSPDFYCARGERKTDNG